MTSYSTLMRKARDTKDPATKRRLLKKANAIRRATRKPHPVLAEQHTHTMNELEAKANAKGATLGWTVQPTDAAGNRPGQGEIVGAQPGDEGKSPIHRITDNRIEQVLKLAKGKDDGAIGVILRAIAADGMSHGRNEARRDCNEAERTKEEILHRRIICDLLRQIRVYRQLNPNGGFGLILSDIGVEHIERALTTKAGFRI